MLAGTVPFGIFVFIDESHMSNFPNNGQYFHDVSLPDGKQITIATDAKFLQRSFGKQLHTILTDIKNDEETMASMQRRLSERDNYARHLEGELTRLRVQSENDAKQV